MINKEEAQLQTIYKNGLELKKSGNFDAAEKFFRTLLKNNNDDPEAHLHLGNTLVAAGRLEEGINKLKKNFSTHPSHTLTVYNLGYALFLAQRYQEALLAFNQAVTLKQDLAEAIINRGCTFHALGLLESALKDFDQALSQYPDIVEGHWNRALTLLTMGRYKEGFRAYKWRWQRKTRKSIYPYTFFQPAWQGQPFPNQRLLVFSEQGLGDAIQFARFLPLVKTLGGFVIFEVKPELKNLLKGFRGIDEIGIFSLQKQRKNDFDLQIPLMDLPTVLDTKITELPPPAFFLVDQEKRTFWRRRIDPDQLNIGLIWAGNPKHSNDHHRSLPLSMFTEIAALDNIHLYSLQKGPPNKQLDSFPYPEKITDCSSQLNDFSDTAAVISELDLIISVDTATAHLAASLNQPTWIIIPYVPDWRWQRVGRTSSWYQSATLFRQLEPGIWNDVISRIRQKIEFHGSAEFTLKGIKLRQQGDLEKAAQSFHHALALNQQNIDAHYNLGLTEKELHKPCEAKLALEKALVIQPNHDKSHIALGNLKIDLQDSDGARKHYNIILKKDPKNPAASAGIAQIYIKNGQTEQARETLTPWLKNHLSITPEIATVIARIAHTSKERQHACNIIRKLLKEKKLARGPLRQLNFTLGELNDELENYDEAFSCFTQANQAKAVNFDSQAHIKFVDELIRVYSKNHCKNMVKSSYMGTKPTFIIGMPRSGTTLTEQILASHPEIHGAGELGQIRALCRNLDHKLNSPKKFPENSPEITRQMANRLGFEHIDFLTKLAPKAKQVIDKNPQNFLFLGFIEQLWPNSHVIHCQRHPLDTILSIFFQNFSAVHSYAFNLENIALWYKQYHRLMCHWETCLNLKKINVQYEKIVNQLEEEASKIINFLNLDWHPKILNFQKQISLIHTASYQQVRKPLYKTSIQRWQNYEKHLGKVINSIHEYL